MNKEDEKAGTTGKSPADKDDKRFWRALQTDDSIQTLHRKPPADEELPPRPVGLEPAAGRSGKQDSSSRPIELTEDLTHLDADEQEHRLQALRSMLAASEARQQQVLQTRLPALTTGTRVAVRSGPYRDYLGTIQDADFIHSRVLLALEGIDDPQWIPFSRLAPVAPDVTSDNAGND